MALVGGLVIPDRDSCGGQTGAVREDRYQRSSGQLSATLHQRFGLNVILIFPIELHAGVMSNAVGLLLHLLWLAVQLVALLLARQEGGAVLGRDNRVCLAINSLRGGAEWKMGI